MKYQVVIPARLASKRFPNKLLAKVNGFPVIGHAISYAPNPIVVCSESDLQKLSEILYRLKTPFYCILCSPRNADIRCGTDRIASVIDLIDDADLIINLQGDNILYPPDIFNRLAAFAESKMKWGNFIATVVTRQEGGVRANLIKDSNIVTGFSRQSGEFHHCGIYCYPKSTLKMFYQMEKNTRIERRTHLEQLRWLNFPKSIFAMIDDGQWYDINTPQDIEDFERKF